jgi:hypothetical protein
VKLSNPKSGLVFHVLPNKKPPIASWHSADEITRDFQLLILSLTSISLLETKQLSICTFIVYGTIVSLLENESRLESQLA